MHDYKVHRKPNPDTLDETLPIEEGFATVLPTDRVCRVRSALDKLGQLTSAITDNDVLNTILGKSCIGK